MADDPLLERALALTSSATPRPENEGDDPLLAQAMAQAGPPSGPPSAAQRVGRGVGLVGSGFNEGLARTVGAVPDLMLKGLSKVGLPVQNTSQYTDWARRGIGALVGQPMTPETTGEKLLYGAGQGVADAASFAVPATAAAQGALGMTRAGSMGRALAEKLAAQPGAQAVAGAAGGAVREATDNPWLGLLAGVGTSLAGAGLGRAISPALGAATDPARAALANAAKAEGIPVSLGQETGNRVLRNMESTFGTLPTTAGAQAAMDAAQRTAFNRAVLGRAGIQADKATPDVLQAGRTAIGQQFDALSARNALVFDQQLGADLGRIVQDVNRYSTPEVAKPILNRVADFVQRAQGGTVPGQHYRKLDSALGRTMRSTTNGDLRATVGELRDTIRGAMDRSISPADREAWQEARGQYRNLMAVGRAMDRPGEGTALGDISPAALGQATRTGPSMSYAFGRGDLDELSRVGQAVLKPTIPNSGTPERLKMAGWLMGGSGGASMLGADFPTAAATGVAGLVLPRVVQAAYNTQAARAYLTNQLAAGLTPTPDGGLLGAQAAASGLGALRARMLEADGERGRQR